MIIVLTLSRLNVFWAPVRGNLFRVQSHLKNILKYSKQKMKNLIPPCKSCLFHPCFWYGDGDNIIHYIVANYHYFSPLFLEMTEEVRKLSFHFFCNVCDQHQLIYTPTTLPSCVVNGIEDDIIHPIVHYTGNQSEYLLK